MIDDDGYPREGSITRKGAVRVMLMPGDIPMPKRVVWERWLRVEDDGEERWFDVEPGIPSLRVRLYDACGALVEETYTFVVFGHFKPIIVPPRGRGWTRLAAIQDGTAVWRRPHAKGDSRGAAARVD